MAVHSPRRKLTYEDFLRFPDDGRRHEILDGVHVVTAAPGLRHQLVLGELFFALKTYLRANPLGKVAFAPLDVLLAKHDVVEPDLLYIANPQSEILTKRNVKGAPALVAEVHSKSSRRLDLVIKRERYELSGIQEYWVLDPYRDTANVFRRRGDRFAPPLPLAAETDDRLTTPLLPGFKLPLRELFAR
jgi:Uma2 family endonuclease